MERKPEEVNDEKVDAGPVDGSETDRKKSEPESPYKQRNLDPDNDGQIDHHPDDPGVDENDAPPKRGLFGRS